MKSKKSLCRNEHEEKVSHLPGPLGDNCCVFMSGTKGDGCVYLDTRYVSSWSGSSWATIR